MLAADLTTVAQRRHAEAPKLIHLLRGDLDWIVMKALEKDRTRRYETANGLAMDVRRHLSNDPVVARPPSTLYRFQKLVRRNKTIFATAGVGLAALVVGLILSLYLFVQERSALKRAVAAEQAEANLRKVAEKGAESSRQIAHAGQLLMRGQYDESEQALRGIPSHETLVPIYSVYGGVHARRGEWREALTNYIYVVQYAPAEHMGYLYLAPLLLQMGDASGYRDCRAQILRQFGNTTDPRIAQRMAEASLLIPADANDMPVIEKMAAVAVSATPNHDNWGFNLFAKGLAEYRLGHFAEAASLMRQIMPLDAGRYCRTQAYLVLAMAQFHLNQADESRQSFAEAMELEKKLPQAGHLDEEWNDWIAVRLWKREAAALIPGVEKAGPEAVSKAASPAAP
jgi:hypothetical protein